MAPLALDRHLPSRERAFQVARIGAAGLFLAHAVVRILNNTIPQFAAFLASQGFPQPTTVVWVITVVELIAALCLVVRFRVPVACAALASVAIGGILLVHIKLGWFVGEHGTGGSEFSVALLLLLFLIAIDDVAGEGPPCGSRESDAKGPAANPAQAAGGKG